MDIIKAVNLPDNSINLYSTKAIYTRSFKGFFRNLRIIIGFICLSIFFTTVWIKYNDRQAIWCNIQDRQFFVFNTTFFPHDFFLLAWILIICAYSLFLITNLVGRVWCGYICPQSTWMWIFMWVEKVIEGDRNARMKLSKANFSIGKAYKFILKHTIWILIAFLTATTFVGYFSPIRELMARLFSMQLGFNEIVWLSFFTIATYVNAGILREQVCTYMCPYARFQSVMFDDDTLIVAYDEKRGETRGSRKKHQITENGDCIDCQYCVQVCPTGIDIRNGLQLECLGCAACIDACNSIMSKMGYKPNLIKYTTGSILNDKTNNWNILRPRVFGYATALFIMLVVLSFSFSSRSLVKLDVLKDRGMFRENALGQIENVYIIKIINKSQTKHSFVLNAEGINNLNYSGDSIVEVDAGEIKQLTVRLSAYFEDIKSQVSDISFKVNAVDNANINDTRNSRFMRPIR